MQPEPSLLAPIGILAIGLFLRVFGVAELVVGVATPVADPKLTAEFVGDFIVVVGLVTLALTVVEMAAGLPELVWLAFGAGVVLAVAATPALVGRYVAWRVRRIGGV